MAVAKWESDSDRRQSDFAETLTEESLLALAAGELLGIWLVGYFEPAYCQKFLQAIRLLVESNDYTLTEDLQSLGTTIAEANDSAANEGKYFADALLTTRVIRDVVFQGRISPADRLRLELDETWPAGATLARYRGRPMLAGTIRRWRRGGAAKPHWDLPDAKLLRGLGLTRRLASNAYLQTPRDDLGGRIEFWDLPLTERDYEAMRMPDYGLDRARLGPPTHTLQPGVGDLLLFDSTRIHGVEQVRRGERVTVNCFVGVRDHDSPLRIFA